MNRLTKKYEDNSGYDIIEDDDSYGVAIEVNLDPYRDCVDKLGRLEDLMEKYNLNDLNEVITNIEKLERLGILEESIKFVINYLKKWNEQLNVDGANSKLMVRNDIQFILEILEGVTKDEV